MILITGITGQIGSYLAELYVQDMPVIGVTRRTSSPNTDRLKNILGHKNLTLVEGDITDYASMYDIINKYKPNYIANLAAQSHVHTSFQQPLYTWKSTAESVMILMDILSKLNYGPKVVQATSSETFGDQYDIDSDDQYICTHILDNPGIPNRNDDVFSTEAQYQWNHPLDKHNNGTHKNNVSLNVDFAQFPPFFSAISKKPSKFQNENTKMNPRSPYAIAKLAAYHTIKLYRDSYGIFGSNAILFNSESPRRGVNFVTRKITKYVADLKVHGFSKSLQLGNLDASRDWSHAKDTCRGFQLLLQHDKPLDIVFSSGVTHTIKDFLYESFRCIGLRWNDYVEIDENLKRPCEVPYLCGDAAKARDILRWKPHYDFESLVHEMVESDIHLLKYGKI